MALLADLDGKEILFTWGLFGVQSGNVTEEESPIVSTLHQLSAGSAQRVDHLQDENHVSKQQNPRTTIFVAYWLHHREYLTWNEKVFLPFWNGLPDDAGVWREVMRVPKSRYMFSTSSPKPSGFATLVGTKLSKDAGYWKVYRHRMSQTPDQYTTPGDTFTSPYSSEPSASRPEKKLVDLETKYPDEIQSGRVKITKIPDNLCFCREVQAQPDLPQKELEIWREQLNPYFRSWVDHLDTHHNKNGIISFSTHVASKLEDDAAPEADQLMYFLDLESFELSGRSFKDHVKLRNKTMGLYGPGGELSGRGKLHLMVELCILKSDDLDAEYIGCKKGTRLMILEDL
ncbi:hypothetical protein NW762_003157 [Fusarium torreyae]|uniref:Hem-containing dehydratase protein n=1 Tax=Fusarium torreyae TaxID=1237075 RepID=A0A9W8S767_9HYPO|nr:hypothetical protein NW762_003157 [Fusarium torreyae]